MEYYNILTVAIIVVFLLLRFRYGVASRAIVVAALAFLMLAAVLSGTGFADMANELVIVAFYLIGAGLVLLAYDLWRENREPMSRDGPVYRSYLWMREYLRRLRS